MIIKDDSRRNLPNEMDMFEVVSIIEGLWGRYLTNDFGGPETQHWAAKREKAVQVHSKVDNLSDNENRGNRINGKELWWFNQYKFDLRTDNIRSPNISKYLSWVKKKFPQRVVTSTKSTLIMFMEDKVMCFDVGRENENKGEVVVVSPRPRVEDEANELFKVSFDKPGRLTMKIKIDISTIRLFTFCFILLTFYLTVRLSQSPEDITTAMTESVYGLRVFNLVGCVFVMFLILILYLVKMHPRYQKIRRQQLQERSEIKDAEVGGKRGRSEESALRKFIQIIEHWEDCFDFYFISSNFFETSWFRSSSSHCVNVFQIMDSMPYLNR